MASKLAVAMGVVLVTFGVLATAQQQISINLPAHVETDFKATLDQYCVACHNDTLLTAGMSLQYIDVKSIGDNADTWEKILRKLKVRSMPPAGMPRPDIATYNAFSDYLETSLDKLAADNPQPGKPMVRRINRTEYLNAVRDLFSVEIRDNSILPTDDTMFGFDNISDVLTLSPFLAEQYIAAARKVRIQALGEPVMQPLVETYTVSTNLLQEVQMSEDLPFGSRGGVSIEHHFPHDGEYVMQVRLQRNSREYIRGLAEPHQIDMRLNGRLLEQFTIGGQKFGKSSGIYSTAAIGDIEQEEYERTADEMLDVRFVTKAGSHRISVSFLDETTVPEEPLYPRQTRYDYSQFKGGVPGVHTVSIGGPYNTRGVGETASRERILTCQPTGIGDLACAEKILSTLAHRAYRRPPTRKELEVLMGFYRNGSSSGFEEGIGLAMERMLAGPEFLFIVERTPANVRPGETFRISDSELATKLSLFLWSSVPDVELLDLAESGHLSKPGILEQQVQRLLENPRSRALVDNFASQWLSLGRLNVTEPNTDLFPYFEENLRQAFREETALFFDYILREDRPLMELLDADYTFVNERLARHYGIPDVYGNHFRKIKLTDPSRGGLLGHGSILTATSYPDRTSPVIRGKWILENILSAPPPAPPADIPGLRVTNDEGKALNMRESMEQHRANPVCAGCHKAMDPLGFALENYDAVGTWRTIYSDTNSVIDASGVLPDGTPFVGPVELRQVLLEKRQYDFVTTVADKLLTYALGRGVVHTDFPVIRSIIKKTDPDGYRLSSIITEIVKSKPFQMRSAQP